MTTSLTKRTRPLPTVYFDVKTGVARINKRELEDGLTKDYSPSETASALDDLSEFLRAAIEILSNKERFIASDS